MVAFRRDYPYRFEPNPDFRGAWIVLDQAGLQLGTLMPNAANPAVYGIFYLTGFFESLGYCDNRLVGAELLASFHEALAVTRYGRDESELFRDQVEAALYVVFLQEAGRAGYLHEVLTEENKPEEDRP